MSENTENKKTRNEKLKEIRIASKLTQDEIASYLGITRSSYQHLEAKGNLTGDILFKLSRIFSRPIEDFIDDSPARLNEPKLPIFTSPAASLSQDEKEALRYLSSLNAVGIARALGYLQGLSWNEEFTRPFEDEDK